MVRYNYQPIDFIALIVVIGFSILIYVCMCVANWHSSNQKLPEYVPDFGLSTGIMMPSIYQLQVPVYRKPKTAKRTCV